MTDLLATIREFDDDLQFILGRPCFIFIKEAVAFRKLGHKIATQAEAEQAFFIHKMLTFYLEDKATWETKFQEYMVKNIQDAIQKTIAEDKAK